jgi:peroxiredoxin Q/BCP
MRCILLAALVVVACSKSTSPTGSTATSATPVTSSVVAPSEDLAVGKPAPAFSVIAADGTAIDSATLKGKPIVLYFYPKDETPGCTTEACAFRDAWDKLQKSGVVLVGISVDTAESHKAFAAHHQLPFHLVSDPKLELAKRFGVATKETEKFGTIISRQTIVIGKDGNVLKIYRTVDPTQHAAQIEGDLGVGT